ncbi:SRPBCC family protein [Micromonospora musae]|uniref:SRPBCC family protein n=2 Tax=Micromonospora musae TaxID=1894970 RepID=A0ABX9R244_9ACTN|nr:SRPBCC family protein [Micromonospora musae]
MAPNPSSGGLGGKVRGELADEVRNLAEALGERAASALTEKVTGATHRLSEYAKQGGGPGLIAAATGAQRMAEGDSPMKAMIHAGVAGGKEKVMSALGRRKERTGGGARKIKVTNIVETVEVGVPVRVAYDQWTRFGDFPSFMKKVENVDTESDEKLTWKAQVFWSHRTWESTIVRQIPDRLIHWRSKGEKGSVDGTVSFHELTPDLTRILVVLEYHPQGLFEHTGNLWRAQGRRVRLELKHFVRHVMTRTVLDPDSVSGWRGEIEDSRVVKDHDTAVREEQEQQQDQEQQDQEREQGERERPGRKRRAPSADRETSGEEEPGEEEPRRERPRPATGARRRPARRRPADEEYDEYEDEYDEDHDEYEEEPEEPEEPRRVRRRAPERARRARPREEQPEAEEEARPRRPQAPRRPVVRRRREESEQ